LAKQQPSVPRHPIHREEYLSPTVEWGEMQGDIVEAAWTAFLQPFNNRLLKG
jgi:hypothetical protein